MKSLNHISIKTSLFIMMPCLASCGVRDSSHGGNNNPSIRGRRTLPTVRLNVLPRYEVHTQIKIKSDDGPIDE